MIFRLSLLGLLCGLMVGFGALAGAQEQAASTGNPPTVRATSPPSDSATRVNATSTIVRDARSTQVEGEKRFQTNCGRCHMAPHKFPPREMATIVRHMRVRAMITDEDMKLILRYMTQ